MVYLQSSLLRRFEEIIFGFSTKIHEGSFAPLYFNLSHSVGDDYNIVESNRALFLNKLGIKNSSAAFQMQIHSDIATYVTKGGVAGNSDALYTDKAGIGLVISSADCVPIFLYDHNKKVIAGIHSGWRGTKSRIVEKTIKSLITNFDCNPKDFFVYIGPSIACENYEVGEEFPNYFEKKYLIQKKKKLYLDVALVNYDILLEAKVPHAQIQHSNLCSYSCTDLLHSYRRDGANSGRAMGIIAMKGNV